MSLAGKVALVTGASSGIGRATAEVLARRGAGIGALDIEPGGAADLADQIRRSGGKAVALTADVSDAQQMRSAVGELVNRLGRLDVVFANAGINGVWAPLDELSVEEFTRTLRTNLVGTFVTVQAALPYLKPHGGSIIIDSSVNGTRIFSNAGATAYSCSKAGQIALMKMAALELARWRIRVNAICPGSIATHIDESTERRDLEEIRPNVEFPHGTVPLTDGKPGRPEQVGQLVAFLADDESSHITGTEIWIDGAESLLQA